MTRDAFVKKYQDRIAGELVLAVRQIVEDPEKVKAHAGLLGHWMLDVTSRAKQIAGEMYDSLITAPVPQNGPVQTKGATK